MPSTFYTLGISIPDANEPAVFMLTLGADFLKLGNDFLTILIEV